METLHKQELELIVALQKSTLVAKVMIGVSYLGWETFIVLVPLVYVCLSRRLGGPLLFLDLASYVTNNLVKMLCQSPRPYWMLDSVQAWSKSSSYGLPSGHAQMALVGWLTVAWLVRKRSAWVMATALVLAVSFSRVYLGVHFISDVVGGWALGGCVLFVFLRCEPRWHDWVSRQTIWVQISAAALGAALVLGIGLLLDRWTPAVEKQVGWSSFASDARDLKWLFGAAGAIFGTGTGLAMAQRSPGFDIRESFLARVVGLAYAFGAGYLLATTYGTLVNSWAPWLRNTINVGRFALVAWVLTFQAPWVLDQLRRNAAFVPHPLWVRRSGLAQLLTSSERLSANRHGLDGSLKLRR